MSQVMFGPATPPVVGSPVYPPKVGAPAVGAPMPVTPVYTPDAVVLNTPTPPPMKDPPVIDPNQPAPTPVKWYHNAGARLAGMSIAAGAVCAALGYGIGSAVGSAGMGAAIGGGLGVLAPIALIMYGLYRWGKGN